VEWSFDNSVNKRNLSKKNGSSTKNKRKNRLNSKSLGLAKTSNKQLVLVQKALRPKGLSTSRSALKLHPCTAKFAAALADPFSEMALGACVPMGAVSSLKCCSKSIGRMVVGTEGVGFAILMPSAYSNVGGVYTTTSTYGAGVLNMDQLAGSGVDWIAGTRLPFSTLDYNTINARVVAAGLRIRYVGALAERAGTIDLVVQPSHNQLSSGDGGNTVQQSDLSAYPENYHSSVTNQAYTLSMYGINDAERSFPAIPVGSSSAGFNKGLPQDLGNVNTYWFPFGDNDYVNAGTGTGGPLYVPPASAVAYVRGSPGAAFDVEYIIHVEYVGSKAAFGATKVEADPQGVARVCEAASKAAVDANADGASYQVSFARSLKTVFMENAPGLAAKATDMLLKTLSGSYSGASMSTALMI
jgi:hypothetical protein